VVALLAPGFAVAVVLRGALDVNATGFSDSSAEEILDALAQLDGLA
jgi:hypothetical protein